MYHRRFFTLILFALLVAVLLFSVGLVGHALAQTHNYSLSWWTIDDGGGVTSHVNGPDDASGGPGDAQSRTPGSCHVLPCIARGQLLRVQHLAHVRVPGCGNAGSGFQKRAPIPFGVRISIQIRIMMV